MIELVNVYKSYRKTRAVSGVSFKLEEHKVFGLVGPESSGKTTILKLCTGILKPDEGMIFWDNKNISDRMQEYGKMLGYMPQSFGVYEGLTVREYLEFYARMYGMDERTSYLAAVDQMQKNGIMEYADMPMDMLNGEIKQFVNLSRCQIHHPEILILDEPFQNLNTGGQIKMFELLMNLKGEHKTMLISSESIGEIEELCSETAILENGKTAVCGSMEEVMKEVNISRPLKIKVLNQEDKVVKILKENTYVQSISISGKQFAIRFSGGEECEAELLKTLIQEEISVVSYVREKGRM